MSSVNEWVVREYLEALGFLVRQPRKHQVQVRSKDKSEGVDLLAINPAAAAHVVAEEMVWSAGELQHIQRAVVAVRGWHTEVFSPAKLGLAPEIYRFADASVQPWIQREMGGGPVARIVCIPNLPASRTLRKEALELLRGKGVDGVLLFRNLLLELAERIDVNRNYEKSDLLQAMRILKNYDLLKDAQMELFRARRGMGPER